MDLMILRRVAHLSVRSRDGVVQRRDRASRRIHQRGREMRG
jgi:hypothetical protein